MLQIGQREVRGHGSVKYQIPAVKETVARSASGKWQRSQGPRPADLLAHPPPPNCMRQREHTCENLGCRVLLHLIAGNGKVTIAGPPIEGTLTSESTSGFCLRIGQLSTGLFAGIASPIGKPEALLLPAAEWLNCLVSSHVPGQVRGNWRGHNLPLPAPMPPPHIINNNINNPLTARVVGAPQMILQPVFSIFPCSPLPSGTCRTPSTPAPSHSRFWRLRLLRSSLSGKITDAEATYYGIQSVGECNRLYNIY